MSFPNTYTGLDSIMTTTEKKEEEWGKKEGRKKEEKEKKGGTDGEWQPTPMSSEHLLAHAHSRLLGETNPVLKEIAI